MDALLLDTNVWVDYHMPDRPGHRVALKLIDLAYVLEYPLLIASNSLKDFYYIFWRIGKAQNNSLGTMTKEQASLTAKLTAWAATEQLTERATVVGSDAADAHIALKLKNVHFDYEDNLVVAAALRAKARYLVTSDQQLIAHCPVAAVTPEDALFFLENL